eukprot:765492-Hanusia_phi.AAC.2
MAAGATSTMAAGEEGRETKGREELQVDELLREGASLARLLDAKEPSALSQLVEDILEARNPLGASIRMKLGEISTGEDHGTGGSAEDSAVSLGQVERWWSEHGERKIRELIREELSSYTATHKRIEKRLKEATSLLRRVASVSNKVLLASSQRKDERSESPPQSLYRAGERGDLGREAGRRQIPHDSVLGSSERPAAMRWAPSNIRLPFELRLEDIDEDNDWNVAKERQWISPPRQGRERGQRKSEGRVKSADAAAARRRGCRAAFLLALIFTSTCSFSSSHNLPPDVASPVEPRRRRRRAEVDGLSRSMSSLDSFRSAFEKELQKRMEESVMRKDAVEGRRGRKTIDLRRKLNF